MQLKSNLIVRPVHQWPLIGKMMGHTLLALVDTLLQDINTLFSSNAIIPPFVHRTESDIDSHTMCCVWDDSFRTQVIDPIEVRKVGGGVVTR